LKQLAAHTQLPEQLDRPEYFILVLMTTSVKKVRGMHLPETAGKAGIFDGQRFFCQPFVSVKEDNIDTILVFRH
jgi:hypothetical protein